MEIRGPFTSVLSFVPVSCCNEGHYQLHGQTIRFMVRWVKGTQSSGLVNLAPNRHLYKSVLFTEKRPRRPETGIKDGFEGMEHEFPFGIFHPEKQDYLFRCSVAEIFFGKTQKVASHLLSNRISRKMFVNGKQPRIQSSVARQSRNFKQMVNDTCCSNRPKIPNQNFRIIFMNGKLTPPSLWYFLNI